MVIGFDLYGNNAYFQAYTPAINSMEFLEIVNCIVDRVHVREDTTNVDTTFTEEPWQVDTCLLATFQGNLEAGDVTNNGIPITQFAIKRRAITDLMPLTLGYVNFVNNQQISYIDYTQPVGTFIYSVVPVGINGLEGKSTDVQVESDFTGFFVIDRENSVSYPFDKMVNANGSSGGTLQPTTVNTTLNQGRIEIKTLSKYPQYYYTNEQYHTFTVSTVLYPDDGVARSFGLYQPILNLIGMHKPVIVKGSDGMISICDITNPQKSVLQNSFIYSDYATLSVDCTEIMDYNDFINS